MSPVLFVFAARCYASVAYAVMRCPSVRPSICPSVTFVDSVETNKHIFKIFPLSDSHTIVFFSVPNGTAVFRREPPNGGVECRNRDYGPISGFIACCQRCDRPGVINMAAPDRGKLWHLLRVGLQWYTRVYTTRDYGITYLFPLC